MARTWVKVAIGAVALVILAGLIYHAKSDRHRRAREAAYESLLQSYSASLKPGASRKDVEACLRSHGVSFETGRGNGRIESLDDLVPIGRDEDTWVCRDNNVYLQFRFDSAEFTSDMDKLTKIEILHRPGTCL